MDDNIIETLSNELDITQQKLKSKVKSIKIIFREYKAACHEKDYYKSLITKLVSNDSKLDFANQIYELTKENHALKSENDELKKKFVDVTKDLKAYQRVLLEKNNAENVNLRDIPPSSTKETHLVSHLCQEDVKNIQDLKEKLYNLQMDYKAMLDDTQDLSGERDEYKGKFKRLNSYLNTVLFQTPGDSCLDIDKIITENRILMEEYDVLRVERDVLAAKLNKQKHLGKSFQPNDLTLCHKNDRKGSQSYQPNCIKEGRKGEFVKSHVTTDASFMLRYDITSLYNNRERKTEDFANGLKLNSRAGLEKITGGKTEAAIESIVSNPFSDVESQAADDENDGHSSESLETSNSGICHVMKYHSGSPTTDSSRTRVDKPERLNPFRRRWTPSEPKYRSCEKLDEPSLDHLMGTRKSSSCEPIINH